MARQSVGLKVAVTGAAGFTGRAVIDRIGAGALGTIATLRLNDLQAVDHPAATMVEGSYAGRDVRDRLVGDGVDILFHLASLPGGASERDPALGKTVNLDGSIALLDAVAGANAPVVVYASSIAALGRADRTVTAETALRPAGSYGTHKAMVEFYIADLTRRGVIDGRAVRPAGIVARPRDAYAGFATAWMSDLFHAALERRAIAVPVPASAHIWLQSVDAVADNIIHAALMPKAGLPPHRAWTLPATVARIGALADALGRRAGQPMRVEYGDGPFDQPPLDAGDALAVGFVSDGDTDALVDAVLSRIGGLEAALVRCAAIPYDRNKRLEKRMGSRGGSMEMTALFDLSGKVAVVTGSTRGLGYAIAEAMVAHGATVVVSSENAADTEAAATALGATGIPCDVSDNAPIAALVAQTVERFGGIDILVSNAGIQGGSSPDPLDMTVFDRVIAVNLRSMVVLAKHALPVMAGREGASVILIASIAGLRGNARIEGYALAKAAVAQLARNLAVQWGPKGVRSNAIAPGLIETALAHGLLSDQAFMGRRLQMTPLRRVGQPHEVAGAAVFLASPAGGFVNGQVIVVDGGTVITDGS